MPLNFNIDIHCHPTGKPYMSGRNHQKHTPFETYPNEINAWLISRLKKQISNLTGINLSTQSNFDNLSAGKVRVVMVNFTPIEKAFLFANTAPGSFLEDTLKDLVTDKKTLWEDTVKSKVISALTGYSEEDIDFVKKMMLNYFAEGLQPEYDYLLKYNNTKGTNKKYAIKLVKNYTELADTLAADNTTICVLTSIEGAHCLAKQVPNKNTLLDNQGKSHKKDGIDLTPLIDYENNIITMKKWEYPPIYVTLNHHFWNGLGGHAKSLNSLIGTIVSQDEGINEGLKELGKEVIKRLLSKKNGPRIFIDIKHMSPLCRIEFYNFIQQEYWSKKDKFPLICSHTGIVSKSKNLLQLIAQDDAKELNDKSNYLHECSINLCAEDILMVAESKGIIGIQLDEKRIMGKEIINVIKKDQTATDAQLNKQYVKILCANLFQIAKAVDNKTAWDIPTIGSDYDGLINHLDFYPDTSYMPDLRKDVLSFLKNPEQISEAGFNLIITVAEIKRLMFGLTAEEITEKVFAGNVMMFLEKNFNR